MPTLNLKPTHKPVKAYYESLDQFDRLGITHETAVRSAFQSLLESCGKQFDWTLVPEHPMTLKRNKRIVVDGALIDDFRLPHGYWEAKDIHDDLPNEVQRKFEAGYPTDNILFQTPQRAILYQNDRQVLDADLTDPKQLIEMPPNFLCPPSARDRRMGGGSRAVQRHSARYWERIGRVDSEGTADQQPVYFRLCRFSGQMSLVNQSKSL